MISYIEMTGKRKPVITTKYEYKIIIKNCKSLRVKRLIISSYRLNEKEIICRLCNGNEKRYQRNEWFLIDCIRSF